MLPFLLLCLLSHFQLFHFDPGPTRTRLGYSLLRVCATSAVLFVLVYFYLLMFLLTTVSSMNLSIQGILCTAVRSLSLVLIVLHAVLQSMVTQCLEVLLSGIPDSPLLLLLLPVQFLIYLCTAVCIQRSSLLLLPQTAPQSTVLGAVAPPPLSVVDRVPGFSFSTYMHLESHMASRAGWEHCFCVRYL